MTNPGANLWEAWHVALAMPTETPANGRPDQAQSLVKVADAANQPEAELLQGLLREEGVPSVLRRSPGFDVPDFLAAGPRDVFVPASLAGVARDVLLQADGDPPSPDPVVVDGQLRILVVVALIAILISLGGLVVA